MLLGIPGDNTYSNYREANRAFWRETVLPLLGRFVEAAGAWLGPAFGDPGSQSGASLRLGYDADQIDALAGERAEAWARVIAADFLTLNEKRAAVGYGPLHEGDVLPAALVERKDNFNPAQPRVPGGNPDGGQWTDGGGTSNQVAFGESGRLLGRSLIHETHGGGQDCFYQFSYGIVALRFGASVTCPDNMPWFGATHGRLLERVHP